MDDEHRWPCPALVICRMYIMVFCERWVGMKPRHMGKITYKLACFLVLVQDGEIIGMYCPIG